MQDVRDNIRAIIDDSGLKQVRVAEKANIRASKLSEILTKRRKLDIDVFFSLCDVLEVTPDQVRTYHQKSA